MTDDHTKDARFEAMRAFARRWLVLQWKSYDKTLPIPCLNDREVDALAGLFEECAEKARAEERERCAQLAQDCADALEQAERGQAEAYCAMSKARHEQGVAEGALAISETAGVVEGWRDRALTAEKERDEAIQDAADSQEAVQVYCDDYNRMCDDFNRLKDERNKEIVRLTVVGEIIRRWKRADHIRLHAGEMTSAEMRNVMAVVAAIEREVEKVNGDD